MDKQPKPHVWQMIKEAVEVHGNKATNIAIRDWVLEQYPDTNVNTILNYIIICTVNHESRVHYKENCHPRRCSDVFDFLYRTGPGKVEMYDPRLHGFWEITQDDKGVLVVREIKEIRDHKKEEVSMETSYIESKHLRAYLAKNLDLIEPGLELYVDIHGNDGVEYPTDFGPIDLLAIDKNGSFILVEVNTEQLTDVSGQILKYRNWVKRHLAYGKSVRSYLIGSVIPEHVRYSLADVECVYLKEFDLSIKLKDVPKIIEFDTEVASKALATDTFEFNATAKTV